MPNACLTMNEDVRQECKTYTKNQISYYQLENTLEISRLTERVCLVEGQSARLSALEISVKNIQSLSTTSTQTKSDIPTHSLSEGHLSNHVVQYLSLPIIV